MKRTFVLVTLTLGGIAILVLAGAWFSWRSELRRLHDPRSIVEETGLQVPAHVRIVATRARLFSLADGNNYEWLVQSDTSLLPWATTNMQAERGGWERIRLMSDLGFHEEMPSGTRFGGVWRGLRRINDDHHETSYLHLSDDGRVGILSTFRP